LSSREVCLILDSSAKAGVSELRFGDLHVKFGGPAEIRISGDLPPYPFVKQSSAIAPVVDLTEAQHEKQNKDSIEMDEILLREEKLARALVEDPSEYERLLERGELSDDVDSADDADDI
jgi:Tfp pilus assembly pilus retraction ATPase PilT